MTFTSWRERICETNGPRSLFFSFLKPILSSNIENLSQSNSKNKIKQKQQQEKKNGNQKSISHDLAQSLYLFLEIRLDY